MANYFDEDFLNRLLESFFNGNRVEFCNSFDRIEMDIVDVIMKRNGYHKYLHNFSPRFQRCYEIFYKKDLDDEFNDGYWFKILW